jgi:selenocysteine-specific elongation factor
LARLVDEHHAKNPLDPGAALQTIRARLSGRPELVDDAIRTVNEQGGIEVEAGIIRRARWAPRLTPSQTALKTTLVDSLRSAGPEPPSLGELAAVHGADVADLIRILDREGVVVAVEPDRYYESSALTELVARLQGALVPGREYSPSELRDILGLSRKFLIPFLEYCDRRGITERRPGGRVVHGTQVA